MIFCRVCCGFLVYCVNCCWKVVFWWFSVGVLVICYECVCYCCWWRLIWEMKEFWRFCVIVWRVLFFVWVVCRGCCVFVCVVVVWIVWFCWLLLLSERWRLSLLWCILLLDFCWLWCLVIYFEVCWWRWWMYVCEDFVWIKVFVCSGCVDGLLIVSRRVVWWCLVLCEGWVVWGVWFVWLVK